MKTVFLKNFYLKVRMAQHIECYSQMLFSEDLLFIVGKKISVHLFE